MVNNAVLLSAAEAAGIGATLFMAFLVFVALSFLGNAVLVEEKDLEMSNPPRLAFKLLGPLVSVDEVVGFLLAAFLACL